MQTQYSAFRETIDDTAIGRYETYGIEATSDTSKAIRVSDITINYGDAKRLAQLLNENDADPLHLHDIVEDFISQL